MLVTSLGHAATSVVAAGAHILIDPVVTGRFMGGIAAAQPDRVVDLAELPTPDLLVITHFHAGHLEPESLAAFDRATPVAIPDDDTIRAVLDALGFGRIVLVRPGEEVGIGTASVAFTGTGQPFPYVGVLIRSAEGTFWYMGDRGDTLASDDIDDVLARYGAIDALVCSHPSDYHSFLLHSTWDGGAAEGEDHPTWVSRTLEVVERIRPGLVLPQTTSYRYVDAADWMNRYLFPMRPDEYVSLVRTHLPGIAADALGPGDVLELAGHLPTVHRRAAPFVRVVPGPEPRGLDVTVPPPPVTDQDPEGVGDAQLVRRIRHYIDGELLDWLNTHTGVYAKTLRAYRRLGVSYRLTCVLPSGGEHVVRIAADSGRFTAQHADGPLPVCYGEPHTRISASTLDRWSRDVIPYFVAAVDCRRSGQVLDVAVSRSGRVSTTPVETRCLVSSHLMSSRERLDRWLAQEVAALSASRSPREAAPGARRA